MKGTWRPEPGFELRRPAARGLRLGHDGPGGGGGRFAAGPLDPKTKTKRQIRATTAPADGSLVYRAAGCHECRALHPRAPVLPHASIAARCKHHQHEAVSIAPWKARALGFVASQLQMSAEGKTRLGKERKERNVMNTRAL